MVVDAHAAQAANPVALTDTSSLIVQYRQARAFYLALKEKWTDTVKASLKLCIEPGMTQQARRDKTRELCERMLDGTPLTPSRSVTSCRWPASPP